MSATPSPATPPNSSTAGDEDPDDRLHRPHPEEGVSEPAHTAKHAVSEGVGRLDRSGWQLFSTGIVGGIDVSIGVIALVLILHRTGNEIVASMGFAIGFVAITLAGSELITENFLVPVMSVFDNRRSLGSLLRLWGGTLVANLLGGMVVMGVFALGWPDEIAPAVDVGLRAVEHGVSLQSFARAVIAGLLITVMTWMQLGVQQSVFGRVAAAFAMGFLIIYTHSNHVVVGAFEVTAGILAGATDYGWVDLAIGVPWWLLGNMVGGIGLVTVLRIIQTRRPQITE